jgi:hypothetical protein
MTSIKNHDDDHGHRLQRYPRPPIVPNAAIARKITATVAQMCGKRICAQIMFIFFVFFRHCPEIIWIKYGITHTWSADDAVRICVNLTIVNQAC